MKKLLIVSVMSLAGLLTSYADSYAQNPDRAQKREARQATQQAMNQQLANSVKGKNFVFTATEIFSTQNVQVQDVQLNSLWGVWVTPTQLHVDLPIYGAASPDGFPTLSHALNFFVSDFTFDTETTRSGGLRVNISATDPWTMNAYSFTIDVTADGNFSFMTVNSTFSSPVNFRGNVDSL